MGVIVILNQAAGPSNDEVTQEVRQAFTDCGEEIVIKSVDGLRREIEAATGGAEEIIVAGGGDGTLGAVAGEIVRAGKIFGVLPLGTLNHFAKDLGIPLGLKEAARAIVSGRTAAVDVGEVNGRVFLNNSSLGIYPYLVKHRTAQQERLGRAKWHAFVRAAFQALRRYPFLDLRITVEGRPIERRTAFLFIGNNEYEFGGWRAGGRACLDAGRLGVCLAHRTGRLGILRLAVRALFGRLAPAADFETFCADEVTVESRRRRMLVATDGEVNHLTAPLHYRIRRGALRVRVPA